MNHFNKFKPISLIELIIKISIMAIAVALLFSLLIIVDCLLPPQLRKLGQQSTYLTPRRPIRTTGSDCGIRGGEYVAFDQASYSSALKTWLPMAQQGDPDAQTNVGEINEKGLGMEPDYKTAALWYQKAADQNYSRAQINLGHLYEKGLGVKQNTITALNWYRKASGLAADNLTYTSSLQAISASHDLEITTLKDKLKQAKTKESKLSLLSNELTSLRKKINSNKDYAKTNKLLIEQIKNLENIISTNLVLDSRERVAKYIYNNSDVFFDTKNIEIAEILGVSPETLSRILKFFKDQEIINIKTKFIDQDALLKYFE